MTRFFLLTSLVLLTAGCLVQNPSDTTLTLQNFSTDQTIDLGFADMYWTERADLYEVLGTGHYVDEHEFLMSFDKPKDRPSDLRYLHVYTSGSGTNWEDYHIELLVPAKSIGLASEDVPEMLLFQGRISPPQKVSMNQLRFRVPHVMLQTETPGVASLQANGEILTRHMDERDFDDMRARFDDERRMTRAISRAANP
jgi:hypothetical protein